MIKSRKYKRCWLFIAFANTEEHLVNGCFKNTTKRNESKRAKSSFTLVLYHPLSIAIMKVKTFASLGVVEDIRKEQR